MWCAFTETTWFKGLGTSLSLTVFQLKKKQTYYVSFCVEILWICIVNHLKFFLHVGEVALNNDLIQHYIKQDWYKVSWNSSSISMPCVFRGNLDWFNGCIKVEYKFKRFWAGQQSSTQPHSMQFKCGIWPLLRSTFESICLLKLHYCHRSCMSLYIPKNVSTCSWLLYNHLINKTKQDSRVQCLHRSGASIQLCFPLSGKGSYSR